jgi:aminoglycoside phosphotransferase
MIDEQVDMLRRRYLGHEWNSVRVGCSGALVYRLSGITDLYVKVGSLTSEYAPGHALADEADRLVWLTEVGIPTAEVVDHGLSDDCAWLVTTAVSGRSAAEYWPADQRINVIDALADVTRTLHGVPIENCPYDRSLAVTMPVIDHAVQQHMVDLSRLDPTYMGWTAEQLLKEAHTTAPVIEDLVVCHGDLSLPNVLLDPDTLRVTGFVDVGRLGRADRYADLALAIRSITSNQNPQYYVHHADRYLTRYGIEQPDTHRVAFYRLLDQFF